MDWGDLPFFLAVARHGTLARAAKALRTDPTTAGRRVQKLERALGARLFEHTPGGHVLTAAGERLLAKARAMDRLAAEAQAAGGAGAGASPLTGTVRLSVAEGLGSWFVARRIGAFSDAHPAVTVDLVANSGFLNPTRRETDLAVLLARPRKGPLVTVRLTDYSLGLYAARAYLERSGEVRRAEELTRHRLVGYVPDLVINPSLDYAAEFAPDWNARFAISSALGQTEAVRAGAGIGILHAFIARSMPDMVPVTGIPPIRRAYWLVYHESMRGLSRIAAVTDFISKAVESEKMLFGAGSTDQA